MNASGGFSKVVPMAWVEGVGDDGWVEDKEDSKGVKEAVDITEFLSCCYRIKNGCLISLVMVLYTY